MNKLSVVFIKSLITLITSFLFAFYFNKFIIKKEKEKFEGQVINSYLMTNHQEKKNTPTLGGIGIISSIILTSFINFESYKNYMYVLGLLIILTFFLIGIIDDLIKVRLKNYHGLSALIRFLLELLVSIIFYYMLIKRYDLDLSLHLNYKYYLYFGSFYILFFVFILVGSANAINLTDGLDGLAGGLFLISLIPFIIICFKKGYFDYGYLLLSLYGSTFAFLLFNLYPAKIFMGDCGSLALGAIFGFTSIILKSELLLLINGAIFIFETLSVILQVSYFKLLKKRMFLMAPFHHHLEKKGKYEYQIVLLFYVIGFTLSFISLYIGIML